MSKLFEVTLYLEYDYKYELKIEEYEITKETGKQYAIKGSGWRSRILKSDLNRKERAYNVGYINFSTFTLEESLEASITQLKELMYKELTRREEIVTRMKEEYEEGYKIERRA